MSKFVTLLVGVVAMAGVAAAAARGSSGIQSSSSGPITANGSITFGGNTICTVSLTFSLSANPMLKTIGRTQGTVSGGSITSCRSSIGITDGTWLLPGNIQYSSFSGTLPNITSVLTNVTNTGFQLNSSLGIRCLYGTLVLVIRFLFFLIATATILNQINIDSAPVPRVSGGGLCPASVTVRGTLAVLSPQPRVALV